MKRDIEQYLEEWRHDESRQPLLIRGARQVGKSHVVTTFGETAFENSVVVNFEQRPELSESFSSLLPEEIIEQLALATKTEIIPGKTLLFLDEIQDCPKAILALRYFYEQMPQLHVIGAGSLLDFTLASEDFRVPVGRIQYLYLYPLSFGEFLDAMGEEKLRHKLEDWTAYPLPSLLHQHALALLKKYMIIGGMPSVVKEYLKSHDYIRCQRRQLGILQTYRDDFGKYVELPLKIGPL